MLYSIYKDTKNKLNYDNCLKLLNTHLQFREIRNLKGSFTMPQTTQQYNVLYNIYNDNKTLLFYDQKKDPNFIFSNFYVNKQKTNKETSKKFIPYLFEDENKEKWYTSESYYRAQKYKLSEKHEYFQQAKEYYEFIREADSGFKANYLGCKNIKKGKIRVSSVPLNKFTNKEKLKNIRDRYYQIQIVSNWEDIKIHVMKKPSILNLRKFTSIRKIIKYLSQQNYIL